MSRILVTGANGQLGSELKFLSASVKSHSFVFVSRGDLDISNQAEVEALVKKEKVDLIINCAAYTAVDKAESEKEAAYMVNGEAVGILASIARSNNCRFIHFSTDFVFDGTTARPLLETDSTNPLSVYGLSKLKGEELAMGILPGAVIIRTSWVYSSYGNNFVKTIIRLCKEREELNIIYDQVGSPTYARDLAQVALSIVDSKEWKPGIYNFSNEGIASWYDFAIAIRDMAGLKTRINPIETSQYPTPATRPKYSVLNKKKIKEAFTLTIPYWRTSLADCLKLLS